MNPKKQPIKEVYCQNCKKTVQARYTGLEKGMERYECLDAIKQGTQHPIFVNPQERKKISKFGVQSKESTREEKSTPLAAGMPSTRSNKLSWHPIKNVFAHYGMHQFAEKIFSSNKTEKSDELDKTEPLEIDIPHAQDFKLGIKNTDYKIDDSPIDLDHDSLDNSDGFMDEIII
mgnify:CR=1 FL=1